MEGKTGFEQTPEERVTEWGLQRGSMTEHGKFRIYDKYLTKPTVKEFAAFLRHEYGTGGSYAFDREFDSDGKGKAEQDK